MPRAIFLVSLTCSLCLSPPVEKKKKILTDLGLLYQISSVKPESCKITKLFYPAATMEDFLYSSDSSLLGALLTLQTLHPVYTTLH